MKLFIGNIPGDALLVDLYSFLGSLKLQADFQPREGVDCHRKTYHYVIAQLSSEQDMDELIYRLDGMDFQGSHLAVREYKDRNPCPAEWSGQEKRINLH